MQGERANDGGVVMPELWKGRAVEEGGGGGRKEEEGGRRREMDY